MEVGLNMIFPLGFNLLFEQVIIPCDYYVPEPLLEFAQDVINEAKSHECKVERYQVNDDGKKVNAEVWDYGEI